MVTRSATIPFVDEMRGVAILAVFLFHSLGTGFGIERIPWNGLTSNFNDAPRSFLALLPLTFGWAGIPIFLS